MYKDHKNAWIIFIYYDILWSELKKKKNNNK